MTLGERIHKMIYCVNIKKLFCVFFLQGGVQGDRIWGKLEKRNAGGGSVRNNGRLELKGNDPGIMAFRKHIEEIYRFHPTGCGGGFDEILCYELHTQPVNPRMQNETLSGGFSTGLTFRELANKWGISVGFLGKLICDHCEKLDNIISPEH